MIQSQILGTGRYLPDKIITNKDLEKLVETNDSWIVERTGIRERHIATPEQATSDLALPAAKLALEAAGISPKDLDMILFATCTPDYFLPNTACELQRKLGASTCVGWDLSAACSGFIYVLSVANLYVQSGRYKNILVVGAETLSRIVNWKDRETCILFGDGAGAAVVGPSTGSSAFLGESLSSDGNLADLLALPGGGSKMPMTHELIDSGKGVMVMKGREIFKNAVRTMSRHASEVLETNKLTINDVQWVIPHQANQRIIEAVCKQMDIPASKVIMNLELTGNTSAGSVPIALDEAIRAGQVKRGDLILLTVFGAGLTSGAILLRY